MNNKIVSIQGLTKRFGDFIAVDNVTMDIRKGEVFGFLGPNGSGKTTTIRMLCGILNPTSGEGEVCGNNILTETEKIKFNLGYMSQKFSLYNDLTVRENLEFYAGVYSIPLQSREGRIAETIAMAGLEGRERSLVSGISSAVKQRLALGTAILNDPAIVFLDEPTGGVDPISRRNFWEVIYRIADRGTTVMVTTHYMDEAELCSRLAFIYEGRLIAQGTPGSMKNELFAWNILRLDCGELDRAYSSLRNITEIHDVYYYSGYLHVLTGDVRKGTELVRRVVREQKDTLKYLEPIEPSLEDVFISLVERSEREKARALLKNSGGDNA